MQLENDDTAAKYDMETYRRVRVKVAIVRVGICS